MTAGLAVPEGICDHYTNTAATLSITVSMYPPTLKVPLRYSRSHCLLIRRKQEKKRPVDVLLLREKDTGGGELWSALCMLHCKVYH